MHRQPTTQSPPVLTVMSPLGNIPVEHVDYLIMNRTAALAKPVQQGFVREGEVAESAIERIQHADIKRLKRFRTSVGFTLKTLSYALWCLCIPFKWVCSYYVNMSHDEIDKDFSELCLNAIRLPLKIKLLPHKWNLVLRGITAQQALLLYRIRRCSAPPAADNPLNNLKAFTTPPVGEVNFNTRACARIGLAFMKARKLHIKSSLIEAFQSIKSGFYFPRALGGFNRCVGILSKVTHNYTFVSERDLVGQCVLNEDVAFPGRPNAESFYKAAVEQQNQYLAALNLSIGLLLTVQRPLFAFAVELQERGNKRRTPNIPEEFAQIAAKAIGNFGLKCLEILFPVEFRKRGTVKMKKHHIYKSGDYEDSTSYIYFTAARTAWKMVLDHIPITKSLKGVLLLVLDKLIGPHVIFADDVSRARMRGIVFPEGGGVPPPTIEPYKRLISKDNTIPQLAKLAVAKKWWVPLEAVPDRAGELKGRIKHCSVTLPIDRDDILANLNGLIFQIPKESILTQRGILMSYGIANTALFILNAIPHWGMSVLRKGAQFFCSGDDNASGFKGANLKESKRQMARLEHKKEAPGMKVHTARKAFESVAGFVLTEDLYLERKGKEILQKVPNFPIRALFPVANDSFGFISVPMSVRQYVKDIQMESIVQRISGLILHRYSYEYRELRSAGISVTGPFSIITWLEWDGLPYTARSIGGLYNRPTGLGSYSTDCDVGDFVLAKKVFGYELGEPGDPYLSRRINVDTARAILSSVPLVSPYMKQPPYNTAVLGDVSTVIDKVLKKPRSEKRYAYGPNGEVQVENLPTRAFGIRNPYDPHCWTYTGLGLGDIDREFYPFLPKVEGDTFHSDIWCLSKGIGPTSHPLEPISFESLFTMPRHIIIDVRNTWKDFEESKYECDAPVGKASGLCDILCALVTHRFSGEWSKYPPTVYWMVLEQPGTPRVAHVPNNERHAIIVIARPTRHNLGADSEVISLYKRISISAPGVRLQVLTKDRRILKQL